MEILRSTFALIDTIMSYTWTWGSFTFDLWDVFKLSLYLCLVGYCIGRVIHLNNGE